MVQYPSNNPLPCPPWTRAALFSEFGETELTPEQEKRPTTRPTKPTTPSRLQYPVPKWNRAF